MAPFGLKLWENAFQMIPNISFVDAGNQKNRFKKFDNMFVGKFFAGKNFANCLF